MGYLGGVRGGGVGVWMGGERWWEFRILGDGWLGGWGGGGGVGGLKIQKGG